jgi:hypothetical protein
MLIVVSFCPKLLGHEESFSPHRRVCTYFESYAEFNTAAGASERATSEDPSIAPALSTNTIQ